MEPTTQFSFSDLLERAVRVPGILSQAYHAFHGYSIGNQLLALIQCELRGITPGPIATFVGWKDKGRSVRKGEKAIVLCMPITVKRRGQETDATVDGDAPAVFTKFVYRPHWFVLSQTQGADVPAPAMPEWNAQRAIAQLQITEETFTHLDGNCQGYARERTIAVSPIAELPHKTRFHELAHVVLGHTSEAPLADGPLTPRSLREVEAESVAMVCLEALGLPGAEYCRGYIQHWNAERGHEAIPERSAQKIFKAADTILRAGRETSVDAELRAA